MATNDEPELVRTTDLCVQCDSYFHHELVARYRAASTPSGFAHVELRHLPDHELEHLLETADPQLFPLAERCASW